MLSGNTKSYFRCISMIFLTFALFFSQCIFDGKSTSQWVHHIPAINCDEGIDCYSTRIELFYFADNFRRIAQWVLALKPCIDVASNLLGIDLQLDVRIACDGLQQKF